MPTSDLLSDVRGLQTIATFGLLTLLFLWETLAPYIAFKRRGGSRAVHTGRNVLLSFCNLTMQRLIFIGAWHWLAEWTEANQFGLLNLFDMPLWAHAIGALLLFDVWTYFWHRINHEVFFFWRFHQVHHSDTEMDVTTAYRFHFGEMFLSSCFRMLLIPILGIQLWEVALFDLIIFANVQFHHANIGISPFGDRILRIFLTSPEMHKVHHSMDPEELNSNYTAFLSVWDRLFGTFKLNPNPHAIKFGVEGYRDPSQLKVVSLLKNPFTLRTPAKPSKEAL